MKLLQLNAWGGRLEPQIGNLLQAEKPDIVCLQEAISFGENGSGLFMTIEKIQNAYNLPFLSFGPVFSFNYMRGTARFGNCNLSRYPIKKTEVVFTHQQHEDNFMWGESSAANMRNFVHSVIDIGGQQCNVLTHHGYWIADHKNGNAETVKQIGMIADYIAALQGPVILTGDFNLAPTSKSLVQLNETLENLSMKYKLKTTRNQLTYKTEVCDYVFVNDQVNVKSFEVSDELVSDHKALILEFDIK